MYASSTWRNRQYPPFCFESNLLILLVPYINDGSSMERLSFMRRQPWRRVTCTPMNAVSVSSGALGLLFIIFTLSLIATIPACSREDAAGSSPVSASPSAHTAATDLGQRDGQKGTNQTALPVESESSASSRRNSATGIASISADTDGDAAPDLVEVCDQNKLCIEHPSKSSSRVTYSHPLWETLSLVAVEDTDGEPGAEVIILAMSADTGVVCVCVIRDRSNSVEPYADSRWHTVKIEAVVDTNGAPGKEIVLVAHDAEGALTCVCVIDDRGRVSRPYIDSSWQSVGLGWIEDTNGVPGKEIVIEARNTNGDLLCVCIIHDDSNRLSTYSDALWKSAAIYLAADTDGQPGVEIVLTYAVDGGGGVGVVRDRTEETRTYTFLGDSPAIQLIGDFDRAQGQEVCVLLSHRREYVLITDRVNQQQTVTDCTPAQFHTAEPGGGDQLRPGSP